MAELGLDVGRNHGSRRHRPDDRSAPPLYFGDRKVRNVEVHDDRFRRQVRHHRRDHDLGDLRRTLPELVDEHLVPPLAFDPEVFHRLADGDVVLVGHYEIVARLEGASASQIGESNAAQTPAWGGWDSHVPEGSSGVDPAKWDRPAPQSAISGVGSGSAAWAPPRIDAPAPPVASAWAQPEPAAQQPSSWSSAASGANPPSALDVWGQLATNNDVDWARGGFASQPLVPTTPPVVVSSTPPPAWGASTQPPAPAPVGGGGTEWAAFLAGVGLQATDFKVAPAEVMAAAGAALRRLVAGMVVMMEARARAKAQLGAQGTSLEFDGNNPLKFVRSPEKAIAQLLSPPDRGYMPTDRAIEDAFRDLQAHQMATLAAMQGALAATLARFSPAAIRARAETGGLLSKIMPNAREATLWQAYEREFEGVARGSDEAFMEVFAKEFREAYEDVAADMKARR